MHQVNLKTSSNNFKLVRYFIIIIINTEKKLGRYGNNK